jgi:hypothetical protein
MPSFRFGKQPRKSDYRTLRLKTYLGRALAPPPLACDVLEQLCARLGHRDLATLFPMNGNDQYGDCTIVAAAHAVTIWNGLAGRPQVMSAEKAVKLYLHLAKGIDAGLTALDVLDHWRKTAINGERILAFASLDLHSREQVKQAIALFGGVYLGFAVPVDCIADFNARRPWTPGPRLLGAGHAVFVTGYDDVGVTVLTWGSTQKATWAWWDDCVDEAYAVVQGSAKKADFAPGFDFDRLVADLRRVAS